VLAEALQVARAINNPMERIGALEKVARHLGPNEAAAARADAQRAARALTNPLDRIREAKVTAEPELEKCEHCDVIKLAFRISGAMARLASKEQTALSLWSQGFATGEIAQLVHIRNTTETINLVREASAKLTRHLTGIEGPLDEAVPTANESLRKAKEFLAEAFKKRQDEPSIDRPGRMPPPEDHIKALFDSLPADAENRAAALSSLLTAVQKQAAEAMQPTIIALLKDAQKLDYEGKAQVCRRINRLLDDTHMAFLNPETDLPAHLMPHRPSESSEFSHILLRDTRHASDGRRHTLRIQLTADPSHEQQRAPRAPRITLDTLKLISTDQQPAHSPAPRPSAGHSR
jgi:hypothetical protein